MGRSCSWCGSRDQVGSCLGVCLGVSLDVLRLATAEGEPAVAGSMIAVSVVVDVVDDDVAADVAVVESSRRDT